MAKDSFVFYRSFYEAIKKVPKKYRPVIYEAVFEYAFELREIPLSGVPDALWTLIKPQLDANYERYENGKKGAEFGKRGGRPRKSDISDEEKNPNGDILKTPMGLSEKTPNVNVNVNENVNANVNENENVNVNVNANEEQEAPQNTPSSPEDPLDHYTEVADYYRGYCILRGYQARENFVDRFLAYRHSKNWKADVRSWADKDAETDAVNREQKRSPKKVVGNFEDNRRLEEIDPYELGLFANM